MKANPAPAFAGFTLVELLAALLILSLLALMSYRGLGAVLDARDHVKAETDKWRRVAAFFARFEQDVQLATPRGARAGAAELAPWVGRPVAGQEPRVEFSRSATVDGVDAPRRAGYRLNEKREIEVWLWPALDTVPAQPPARYPVLSEVAEFELSYLAADSAWIEAWPRARVDTPMPRAVRLRVVLESGEEVQRVFALNL